MTPDLDRLREALPLCACKDRPATECPGEWEPGCDLGNNEAHVKISDRQPIVTMRSGFEAWMRREGGNTTRHPEVPSRYANAVVQGRWIKWQDAIAPKQAAPADGVLTKEPAEATELAAEIKIRAQNAASLPRDPQPRKLQLDALNVAVERLLGIALESRLLAAGGAQAEVEPELRVLMDRNAWRAAMIGLCQGPEANVSTPDLAAEHLHRKLKHAALSTPAGAVWQGEAKWRAFAHHCKSLTAAIKSKMTAEQVVEFLGEQIDGKLSNFLSQDTSYIDPDLLAFAETLLGAEPICPDCNGSGEGTAMTHGHGPDDYEYPCGCRTCKGTGLATPTPGADVGAALPQAKEA